jgi:hypothetical protein
MQLVHGDKLQLSSVWNRKSNILEPLGLSTALALFLCHVFRFFHRGIKPLQLLRRAREMSSFI